MNGKILVYILSVVCLAIIAACGGGGSSTTPSNGGGGGGGGGTGPVALNGTVTYAYVPSNTTGLAFSQTTNKPVRNATVKVLQGTAILATGRTDDSGNYQLSYTPSGTAQLQLVVLAETASPAIQVMDNTDGNAVWAISGTLDATTTTKNLNAASGWTGTTYVDANRAAAPFAALDTMYSSARAFAAVRSVSFPSLKVYWSPKNTSQSGNKALGQIGTSHYNGSENAIYILGKYLVDTDEYDSHVIAHEWVHYFQSKISRSDSPGGQHGTGDNLDPRLAFGEGSATAIAAMVLQDPLYVDTLWAGSTLRASYQSAETVPSPTDDPSPGALSEASIIRFIYDVYDSGTNESSDQVGVGLGTIYDILTSPSFVSTDAMVTLGPFVSVLKQQPGVSATAVNTLLNQYRIGPITSQWGDGDVTLRGMYTDVTIPSTTSISLGGGFRSNEWDQNQYYVFTGNGRQITVTTTATPDVDIALYQAGQRVASAATDFGNETLSATTQSGKKYVLILTGFGTTSGNYPVSLNFTSQ